MVVVYVTAPREGAAGIARALVERQVAACVNVVPEVRSVYRWQGAIEEATESLLVIKTAKDRFDALKDAVLELHPYELPEVIALDVASAHAPYAAWVLAESRRTSA